MAIVYKIIVKRKHHSHHPQHHETEETMEQTPHEETTAGAKARTEEHHVTSVSAPTHPVTTKTAEQKTGGKLTVTAKLVSRKDYEKWGRWYSHVKIEATVSRAPALYELCEVIGGREICITSGETKTKSFTIDTDVMCANGELKLYVKSDSQRASTTIPFTCSKTNYIPTKPGIQVLKAKIRAPHEVKAGQDFTIEVVFEKPFRGTILATLAEALGAVPQGVIDSEVYDTNTPVRVARIRMRVPSDVNPGTYKIFVTYSGEAIIGKSDGAYYTENVYSGSKPIVATVNIVSATQAAQSAHQEKKEKKSGQGEESEEEKEEEIRQKLPPGRYTPL